MAKKSAEQVSVQEPAVQNETLSLVSQMAPAALSQVERISDKEKLELDAAKSKREMAKERYNTAVSQVEVADLNFNNTILRLALSYGLVDGDIIGDNGEITRKAR